jgi:hypothetical protein
MDCLGVFNAIFYENEFQNPQIFQQTISLFPEQSTFGPYQFPKKSVCVSNSRRAFQEITPFLLQLQGVSLRFSFVMKHPE